MRQVIEELQAAGCVFRTADTDARTTAGVQANTLDQIVNQVSGLSRRIVYLENALSDPNCTMGKMESHLKTLEERRVGETIERGGRLFRDVVAINMWVQRFKDKGLFRYCVDMVTLIMLCAEPYETIAEGMANAAAAHKAEFNDLTEARISLSYGLTYPDNIMRKQDKEKYAATGGWFWTNTWSSYPVFKGTFNNRAKDTIITSLVELSRMIQNAIDFSFPAATHPIPHAVFTEQLLISRQQASGWIEALEPLYEIVIAAGMSTEEAWEQVLIFTKAIFDDIRMVRAIPLDKANTGGMIWGSFRTAKLLEEYQRLKFYQHPHVSNMLALTSLQREGKKVEKAVSTMTTLMKSVEVHQSKIVQIEKDLKGMKKDK